MRQSAAIAAVTLLVGVAAMVRLAPTDPARWHTSAHTVTIPDCAIRRDAGSARAACLMGGTPEALLARLDAIALATPRTQRIAGSPAEGHMTWETRSLIWGFPDYTTASARSDGVGTRLDLHARLRFGAADLGVNAARLADWLAGIGR